MSFIAFPACFSHVPRHRVSVRRYPDRVILACGGFEQWMMPIGKDEVSHGSNEREAIYPYCMMCRALGILCRAMQAVRLQSQTVVQRVEWASWSCRSGVDRSSE